MSRLYPVIGPESAFLEAGIACLERVLSSGGTQPVILRADTLADVERGLTGSAGDVILVLSAPDAPLSAVLQRTATSTLRFEPGFEPAVRYVMERHDASLITSLRHVARSYAALDALSDVAEVVHLAVPMREEDLAHLEEAMTRFVGPHSFADTRAEPATTRSAVATLQPVSAPSSARLSPEEARALAVLANGYERMAGAAPFQLTWPTSLFLRGDRPDTPLDGPIEMTGPPRLLVYGPYLHLPPGRWEAIVGLAVAQNVSGNGAEIRVMQDGRSIGADAVRLPAEGELSIIVPLESIDARLGIEVCVEILEGAIEGQLHLASVTLRRLS